MYGRISGNSTARGSPSPASSCTCSSPQTNSSASGIYIIREAYTQTMCGIQAPQHVNILYLAPGLQATTIAWIARGTLERGPQIPNTNPCASRPKHQALNRAGHTGTGKQQTPKHQTLNRAGHTGTGTRARPIITSGAGFATYAPRSSSRLITFHR